MTDPALARAIAAATCLTAPCTHRRTDMKLEDYPSPDLVQDRETAEDVVRAEWLHAVDTGAIIDYGSQDAVHAAMDHMADAFAAALAAERARVLAPVLAMADELDALADDHWAVYKHGSPDDPRRANPYTEGVVDAYTEAVARIRRAAQDGERA